MRRKTAAAAGASVPIASRSGLQNAFADAALLVMIGLLYVAIGIVPQSPELRMILTPSVRAVR